MITSGQKIIAHEMKSIHSDKHSTSLSHTQELQIPEGPLVFTQNRKMIALFAEAKNFLATELHNRDILA